MINEGLIKFLSSCSDNKLVSNLDKRLIFQLSKVVEDLTKHLEISEMEKTCNWILEKNRWLKNENKTLPQGFYNYARGDIIKNLDFGTSNFGTEHRYPHPAVVIYDCREDWVVVAPITAAHHDKNSGQVIVHPPFDVLVRKQIRRPADTNEFYFTKDSVIQLDQLRRVSKHRSIDATRYKLRPDVLNQIDNILLKYYLPKKSDLLSKMLELNQGLEEEVKLKNKEIDELKQLLDDKQIQIQSLKLHIQKLQDKMA